jgi:hypothetical protein
MPYIKQVERSQIDEHIDKIFIASPGHLNYAITRLIHNYIKAMGLKYARLNDVIGVLECAKMELYRRITAPYEDTKIIENGIVSDLEAGK